MGELERDDLVRNGSSGLQLDAKVAPVGRRELDRHIAIKGFQVGPNRHAMLLA